MTGRREIRAGVTLFGLVFAAGFVLGSVREVLVRPHLGPEASRLYELPLMIGISYLAATLVVRKTGVAGRNLWLRVGILAFVLLIAAELLLGEILFRRGLTAFIRDAMTISGAMSLLAQALLIGMPYWAAKRTGYLHGEGSG